MESLLNGSRRVYLQGPKVGHGTPIYDSAIPRLADGTPLYVHAACTHTLVIDGGGAGAGPSGCLPLLACCVFCVSLLFKFKFSLTLSCDRNFCFVYNMRVATYIDMHQCGRTCLCRPLQHRVEVRLLSMLGYLGSA
jgi:hypothetical protein